MARAKYILFIISLSVSVYAVPQIEQPLDWQSRLNIEHELVGKIWSSKRKEFITVGEFTSSIEESRYLILGEKHDNPCLLYTSPSPRDRQKSRMPSSA